MVKMKATEIKAMRSTEQTKLFQDNAMQAMMAPPQLTAIPTPPDISMCRHDSMPTFTQVRSSSSMLATARMDLSETHTPKTHKQRQQWQTAWEKLPNLASFSTPIKKTKVQTMAAPKIKAVVTPRMKAMDSPMIQINPILISKPKPLFPDSFGIDPVDLPHDDDGEWLHRVQAEEAEWTWYDEQEKAVSDTTVTALKRKPIFSRVFGLGSSGRGNDCVSIPADYKPSKGSPSACLKSDPDRLMTPISATSRVMVKFIEKGLSKTHFSTAFAVSPRILLSAKHSLDKPNIAEVGVCRDRIVLYHNFLQQGALKGTIKGLSRPGCTTAKDKNGLFVKGADVGVISVSADLKTFLLPCSPTFLAPAQRKRMAILSFPSVDGFMKLAKSELIKGKIVQGKNSIWEQYRPVMAPIYDREIRLLAKKKKMAIKDVEATKALVEKVEKLVKETLYQALVDTFAFTHTGNMVCSVGSMVCSNAMSIGTACSTLRGSSGAPICSLDRPGDFFGVHHGGSYGFDLNSATSCDNPGFVQLYMKKVLPTLPDPQQICWSSRDMQGFAHWLHLHATKIDKASPWWPMACKGLKRKR